MPTRSRAVRQAVIAELRAVLTLLGSIARLLQTPERGATVGALGRAVAAAVARGERALNRLARGP
jgi:hypothetical protein